MTQLPLNKKEQNKHTRINKHLVLSSVTEEG